MKDEDDKTQLLLSDDEEMNSRKKITCSYSRIRKLGLRLLPRILLISVIIIIFLVYAVICSIYHHELSERINDNSKRIEKGDTNRSQLGQHNEIAALSKNVTKISKMLERLLRKNLTEKAVLPASIVNKLNNAISRFDSLNQNITQSKNTNTNEYSQMIARGDLSEVKTGLAKLWQNITSHHQSLDKHIKSIQKALDSLKWYEDNLSKVKSYEETLSEINKALDNLKWYEQNLAQIKTYGESIQDNNKKLNEHDEALDNLKWYQQNLAQIKTYEESIQDNNKKLDSRKSYEDNLSRDVMSLKKRIEKIEQRENKEPRLFRLDYSVFIINIMTSLFALSF